MKVLEFETSKGKFVLVDLPIDVTSIKYSEKGIWIKYEGDKEWNPFLDIEGDVFLINTLKQITEDQASEIVDEFLFNANDGSDYGDQEVYKNYITDEIYLTNPKESLLSLLESKGIYLYEKPYLPEELINNQEAFMADLKAEQKTFYNPYIFKL